MFCSLSLMENMYVGHHSYLMKVRNHRYNAIFLFAKKAQLLQRTAQRHQYSSLNYSGIFTPSVAPVRKRSLPLNDTSSLT